MGFQQKIKTICNNISVFSLCSSLHKKAAVIFVLHVFLISCSDIPLQYLFKRINRLYFFHINTDKAFCCSLGEAVIRH